MTITEKKKIKQSQKELQSFSSSIGSWTDIAVSQLQWWFWGDGLAMSSKGRRRRLFLRWCRFSRRFCCLGSWGHLLEIEVLQCHVQGHDLNTAHGLEVSEIPQRAVTVVLIFGGGGWGILIWQQCGQQQLRHKQAPVGPLGLTHLPLCLRQPWFAQPAERQIIRDEMELRRTCRL